MKEHGFIRLKRSIMSWRWFNDMKTAWLFINLLLMANYCESEYKSLNVKTGQVVTSVNGLMQQTNLTYQEVRTALNHLKSTKDITVETTSKYTLITIENYDDFTCATNYLTNKQHSANKQTTNKQQQYNKYNNINKNNKKINNAHKRERNESFSLEDFERKTLFL